MDPYHENTNMEMNHRFPHDNEPIQTSEKSRTGQSSREVRSTQGLDVSQVTQGLDLP